MMEEKRRSRRLSQHLGLVTLLSQVLLLQLVVLAAAQSSTSTAVNIFIDPVNGFDAPSCGLNNNKACASIVGALNNNGLNNIKNGTTYALRLQDGSYTGSNNYARLPNSVVEISSVSMDSQSVSLVGSGTGSIFIIQSTISIYNISFDGSFYYYDHFNRPQVYPCILLSSPSPYEYPYNTNIPYTALISGISLHRNAQIAYLVSGAPPASSVVTVTNIVIDEWDTVQWVSQSNLLSIASSLGNNYNSDKSWCTNRTFSSWPQVIVSNVRVQNASSGLLPPVQPYSSSIPGLLDAKDVWVTISNVVWLSPVNTLINVQSSCAPSALSYYMSQMNSYAAYTLPPVTISSLTAAGFVYYSAALLSIVGGNVSLTGLNVSNIGHNQVDSAGLLSVAPYSNFSLTNSRFNNVGRSIWQNSKSSIMDSSIVYLVWNLVSTSVAYQTTNLLQNVVFSDNNLRPITFLFKTLSRTEDSATAVQIDSCQFVNNHAIPSFNGGAIRASATSQHSKNTLLISNTLFEANVAFNYGGAIYLSDVSANISSSTLLNNVAKIRIDGSGSLCFVNANYLGGGGIFLGGYSALSLSQNVHFIGNQVIDPQSSSNQSTSNLQYQNVFMSGAIFCCSSTLNLDFQTASLRINVTSDGTTTFDSNTAPLVSDMSCVGSWVHQTRLVACDFEGPSNEQHYCTFGKAYFLVWLYCVIVVSLAIAIGWPSYKIRQKRQMMTYSSLPVNVDQSLQEQEEQEDEEDNSL
eukprot:TRINITY_DN6995_c0_g1_i3.p1 TRINITY_DN6995_c0_g1~~TRINITY_DN6995_c0_g1_i3.p1  ORF type:complete len:745 (-),score=123.42 TRINITY_DN6995_c0_g1_i3:64-2298(-)